MCETVSRTTALVEPRNGVLLPVAILRLRSGASEGSDASSSTAVVAASWSAYCDAVANARRPMHPRDAAYLRPARIRTVLAPPTLAALAGV